MNFRRRMSREELAEHVRKSCDLYVQEYVEMVYEENDALRARRAAIKPVGETRSGRWMTGQVVALAFASLFLLYTAVWWKYSKTSETMRVQAEQGWVIGQL